MDTLLQFLGRLHPVAVHLPIGIFILLAIAEVAALWPKAPRLTRSQRSLIIACGLVFSIATAIFGWLIALDGSYESTLLERHRWLGIAFTLLAAALLAVQRLDWRRTYGFVLAATVAVLGIAGHFGGSITHGEQYLSLNIGSDQAAESIDPQQAIVFDDVIHPILESRCVDCHGGSKVKGDLRFDSFDALLRGGESGDAFVAGNPTESRMIQRIHLPVDHDDHMPPKGKPQPTDEEMLLLEWWIEAGAPHEARVAEARPDPAIAEVIASYLGAPLPPPPDPSEILPAAIELEQQLGALIRPLAANEPWLAVNARLQFDAFGNAELAQLAPIAPAIRWLDLGETAVTDQGLAHLAEMRHLRRLRLDNTAITNAGLAHLAPLTRLESLDLHHTAISNEGLDALASLPRLRSLYLWQTQVAPEAAQRFAEQQTNHRKISRWETEITDLEDRIREATISVNLGVSSQTDAPPPATEVAEVNAEE